MTTPTARPPSIKRQRVTVNSEAGKVAPVGTVELDLIEPREHAAWMQQVADRIVSLEKTVAELKARLG